MGVQRVQCWVQRGVHRVQRVQGGVAMLGARHGSMQGAQGALQGAEWGAGGAVLGAGHASGCEVRPTRCNAAAGRGAMQGVKGSMQGATRCGAAMQGAMLGATRGCNAGCNADCAGCNPGRGGG